MIYRLMGEADIERIMRYPYTAVASDGGVTEMGSGNPHPRSYGTNARVLSEYVRVRGVLTLPDAIRRMTSLPAQMFRLRGRGLVREGMAADLVMFDPARVGDKATFAKPHQYSEGFDFVLVNGKIAVDEGKLTSTPGGSVLRGAAASRSAARGSRSPRAARGRAACRAAPRARCRSPGRSAPYAMP